jgi:glutamyl-tRNA reductase
VIRSELDSSPILDFEVSGTIVSLRERFEAVRCGEIHRLRGRLGDLSPDQEEVVQSLSRDIIEKVLHAPVAMLLSATARNQLPEIVQTVRRIFNLHS